MNNNALNLNVELLTNNQINKESEYKNNNFTEMNYPKEKTIIELFEEQVRKTPDNCALIFQDKKLSYRELNERSNTLARVLRNRGVKSNDLVGIVSERSFELIIGILGVLKSGGAYLIIDPEYPEDRIKFMLEDSNANIVLMQLKVKKEIKVNKEIIELIDSNIIQDCSSKLVAGKPDDLACVIYTSGTTGIPKGVMIEHRNIINVVYYLHTKLGNSSTYKVLQFFSPCFSVCYQEIFLCLLFGGELHIVDKDTRDNTGKLLEYLVKKKTNTLFLPTSYLKVILREKKIINRMPYTVKHIVTAGEKLIITDMFVEFLRERKISLHNNYGTSETNMVTLYTLDYNYVSYTPPIGRPIANTHVYILDKYLNKQQVGHEGEIFVSGDSVGRGYINNPCLTSERFIQDPFLENKLMYRTGDLGKWMEDGNVEFIGRADCQVKIRGFRVELAEVEYNLLNYDSVKEAIVVPKKDYFNNQYLCAFIVAGSDVSADEVKIYLRGKLPEYMVPQNIIKVDELPRTLTGKINRKLLIEKEYGPFVDSKPINCEYNNSDKRLKMLLKKLSGNVFVEEITFDKTLMDCGIDSLTFIQLVSMIEKEFKIEFDNIHLNVRKFENINELLTYVHNKMGKLS